ncbi:MAG: ferrochelatase [Myxococcales bacterium]|nr:ferrochelatase [Myxococcales bacterium]
MTEQPPTAYDAILLLSFGGPEKAADVMPFLEHVTEGRSVPPERLAAVAEHYAAFDGKSPANARCRQLIAALRDELTAHGITLPVYWGNLHWHPFVEATIDRMADDGVQRALVFVTSPYSSYSSCRKYLDAIARAREAVGERAPVVDKIRAYYNHPRFIEAEADKVREAFDRLPAPRRKAARLAFTAHSIPCAMAAECDYEAQLEDACQLVAAAVPRKRWQLVYQSRSGRPTEPWLGPSVAEHLGAIAAIGVQDVVVAPIGFVLEHFEVVWDLDHEVRAQAEELELGFERAGTVDDHPAFVAMIRELIEERIGRGGTGEPVERRRALGSRGPAEDRCGPNCCRYER